MSTTTSNPFRIVRDPRPAGVQLRDAFRKRWALALVCVGIGMCIEFLITLTALR